MPANCRSPKRASYRTPKIRSERIVGQVFANYSCNPGETCCEHFCVPNGNCPRGHITPGAC